MTPKLKTLTILTAMIFIIPCYNVNAQGIFGTSTTYASKIVTEGLANAFGPPTGALALSVEPFFENLVSLTTAAAAIGMRAPVNVTEKELWASGISSSLANELSIFFKMGGKKVTWIGEKTFGGLRADVNANIQAIINTVIENGAEDRLPATALAVTRILGNTDIWIFDLSLKRGLIPETNQAGQLFLVTKLLREISDPKNLFQAGRGAKLALSTALRNNVIKGKYGDATFRYTAKKVENLVVRSESLAAAIMKTTPEEVQPSIEPLLTESLKNIQDIAVLYGIKKPVEKESFVSQLLLDPFAFLTKAAERVNLSPRLGEVQVSPFAEGF